MNVKYKIEELLHYYNTTRQVGHTTTLLENVGNALVLCGDYTTCKLFEKQYGDKNTKFVSYGSLDYNLRGMNKPLVIDNYAMMNLLRDSLQALNYLEYENNKLRNKLSDISQILNRD